MTRSPLRVPALLLGVVLAASSSSAQSPAETSAARFVDRTAESGIDVVTYTGGADKRHILESTGNGVVVLDYDGDGRQDLYFVCGERFLEAPSPDASRRREACSSRLYRSLGGLRFEDVTERAGVATALYGQGGTAGDVDGDGDEDLYVTAFGANLLFVNQGDGRFVEEAAARGVGDPRWSISAVLFDADGDGDLDLFVANYLDATWEEVLTARRTRRWRDRVWVMDGPRGLRESRNAFYRNLGDGRFRDETAAAGFDSGNGGYSMGAVAADLDGDGDLDLYVANDSTANRLYLNRGGGTFEEAGAMSGAAYSADGKAQGSMGVAAADLDGDGLPELAVTNFAHDSYAVYVNHGDALFLERSFDLGVAAPTFAPLGWAALFLDAQNDGMLDLFFANGHIYPQVDEDPLLFESFRQPDHLLLGRRTADGGVELFEAAGALPDRDAPRSSRGAVTVDLDDDGRIDLVVSHQDQPPRVLRNETAGAGAFLAIDARTAAGAPAYGTWLALRGPEAGIGAVREVVNGGGYASHGDPRVIFGLGGKSAAAWTLTLRRPAAGALRLVSPPPNRRLRIVVP
ncbi:MAG TPA: CRTAC1 family protein [Thermoanaerobaculia bacterium]|nr:CRTAC1 family protein [Thermoanaerobaculia bacterium]